MKPFVATSLDHLVAQAGLAAMSRGNVVDALVAAALAWPPSLGAAGCLLAQGAGIGRVACRLPARTPGLGLARPRRAQLLAASEHAASVAAPCAAPAFAALLSRWGSAGLAAAVQAARGVASLPHDEALELLEEAGVRALAKGPWAVAAARALGPIAGGLLTRRDLIEARPVLGPAEEAREGLWSVGPLAGPVPAAEEEAEPRETLAVVALDRAGNVGAIVLDAGRVADRPEPVLGVAPNTLLADLPAGGARKVGRELPGTRAAVLNQTPTPSLVCGGAAAVQRALEVSPESLFAAAESDSASEGPGDLLAAGLGPFLSLVGAGALVHP